VSGSAYRRPSALTTRPLNFNYRRREPISIPLRHAQVFDRHAGRPGRSQKVVQHLFVALTCRCPLLGSEVAKPPTLGDGVHRGRRLRDIALCPCPTCPRCQGDGNLRAGVPGPPVVFLSRGLGMYSYPVYDVLHFVSKLLGDVAATQCKAAFQQTAPACLGKHTVQELRLGVSQVGVPRE
jgi:hypothetical protein